jgi:hypothetical protein
MYVEQKQTNFIKFLNFLNLSKNMSKKVPLSALTYNDVIYFYFNYFDTIKERNFT